MPASAGQLSSRPLGSGNSRYQADRPLTNDRYQYDVFLSYRWADPDQSWVRDHLAPALRASGLRVCLDVEDFIPGRDLILEMDRAGSESKRALCVLSPAYFDGNRMVGFEALMARRKDPMGLDSRLVHLLLSPVDVPEWLRGLVPIDWTRPTECAREWRKLLAVLEAPTLDAPQPTGPFPDSSPQGHALDAAAPPLQIQKVVRLSPRHGPGIGFDIVLRSRAPADIHLDAIELSGRVRIGAQGASTVIDRTVYRVELGSSLVAPGDAMRSRRIQALVYEEADAQWGITGTARLEFELNTDQGFKRWEYFVSIPTFVRLQPGDRIAIRLLFRKKRLVTIRRFKRGKFKACATYGIQEDQHAIAGRLDTGLSVSAQVDSSFLEYISS